MAPPKEFSFKNANKEEFISMVDNKNNKKLPKKAAGRNSQDGFKKTNSKI